MIYVADQAAIYNSLEYIGILPLKCSSILPKKKLCDRVLPEYFIQTLKHHYHDMGVPSHCSIPGNEKADCLVKAGTKEGDINERQIAYDDFFCIRPSEVDQLATKGGRLHGCTSSSHKVKKRPRFKGLNLGHDFIRIMCRMISTTF